MLSQYTSIDEIDENNNQREKMKCQGLEYWKLTSRNQIKNDNPLEINDKSINSNYCAYCLQSKDLSYIMFTHLWHTI